MKKNIDFKEDQAERIQAYADMYCRGNFTLAVEHLVRKGLNNENSN